MEQGWISFDRKIKKHWLFTEKRTFSKFEAFTDLLLSVNHADAKILIDGKLVEVKKGQKITSLRQLSENWSWSVTKTKNYLELLQSDNIISYFSDTKKTVITMTNWELYQSSENKKEHRKNTERTQKEHRKKSERNQKETNNNVNNVLNNVNNVKNVNKEECVEIILEFQTTCFLLPKPTLTEPRIKTINNFIKNNSREELTQLFQTVTLSKFLNGQTENTFKASFDWILKPANAVKILEGNYTDKIVLEEKPKSFLDIKIKGGCFEKTKQEENIIEMGALN